MDTADMIHENRLKQGFIIATLASTIAGTFTTGINLFDRVNEKRRNRHQKKLDKSQTKRIDELERRLEESNNRQEPERQPERQHERIREDDLRGSLEQGGPMVKREYDRLYAAMGPRFAEGDLIAQTQLQSQVITLQSTVIKLLEEALFTGKPLDMNKLYNASEFARIGSIKALRDQTQRLQQTQQSRPIRRPIGPIRRTSSTPSLRSSTTISSTLTESSSTLTDTTSTLSTDSSSDQRISTGYRARNPNRHSQGYYAAGAIGAPPRKALTQPNLENYNHRPADDEEFQKSGPLFCRYAKDLQLQPRQPLDGRCFSPTSSGGCPACGAHFPVSPSSSSSSSPHSPHGNPHFTGYKIEKEVVITEKITSTSPRPGSVAVVTASGAPLPVTEFVKRFEDRTYLLTGRFLVKCHRQGADRGKGYACYLCFKNRERDTLCKTLRGLVGHVGDKHEVWELDEEGDIRDVTGMEGGRNGGGRY